MMIWQETGRAIAGWRLGVAPQADDVGPERGEERHDRGPAPLQTAWRTDAEERSHQDSQVEATGGDAQPVQDVSVCAQIGSSHAAAFLGEGIGSVDALAAV